MWKQKLQWGEDYGLGKEALEVTSRLPPISGLRNEEYKWGNTVLMFNTTLIVMVILEFK